MEVWNDCDCFQNGSIHGNGTTIEDHGDSDSYDEDESDEQFDSDDELHSRVGDFFTAPCRAAQQAEEFVKKVLEAGWSVVHHNHLPNWLRDNEFLHKGHRLPTNSYLACFKSIFRIHTETGNIWTHLLGKTKFIYLKAPLIEV